MTNAEFVEWRQTVVAWWDYAEGWNWRRLHQDFANADASDAHAAIARMRSYDYKRRIGPTDIHQMVTQVVADRYRTEREQRPALTEGPPVGLADYLEKHWPGKTKGEVIREIHIAMVAAGHGCRGCDIHDASVARRENQILPSDKGWPEHMMGMVAKGEAK